MSGLFRPPPRGGDIITAVLAVPMRCWRAIPPAMCRPAAWNLFGMPISRRRSRRHHLGRARRCRSSRRPAGRRRRCLLPGPVGPGAAVADDARRVFAQLRRLSFSPSSRAPAEAVAAAVEHARCATDARAVDIGGAVSDEQDRRRRSDPAPGGGGNTSACRRRAPPIDDLVEMRPQPGLVAQVGGAMVLLVAGGKTRAGTLAPASPPIPRGRSPVLRTVGDELLEPVGQPHLPGTHAARRRGRAGRAAPP